MAFQGVRFIVSLPVLFLAFASVLTSAGCAKDLVTGANTLNYYSIGAESRLGSYVMKMQLKELKRSKKEYDSEDNKDQLKLIKYIVDDIAKVSHYPNFPYEVHLADVAIVNAWCAPGGKIMVYEGLWDPVNGLIKKGDVDELAAVLAHEIAHATARHITESISRNMTIYAIGATASQIISTHSSVAGDIFESLFTEGLNIFIPSYSRKNEAEADRIGLMYMASAGYDPRAAVRVWERAARGKKGDRTSIYSTHPSSGERANLLKKYLKDALVLYEQAKASGKGKWSERMEEYRKAMDKTKKGSKYDDI